MSDTKNQTIGWNGSYFGKPVKGSLNDVIANITNKQNEVVGGKPEVQDSQVVTAKKEAEEQKEAVSPAQQAAIAVNMKKQGKKPKNEDEDEHMKEPKSKDKGNIKVHGEEFEKAREFKVQSMLDALKKVYETNANDKSDDGDGLDKVQPDAVKKKFKDRKDKDIDNDGDVDSSDKFLHKRRKAISKAIEK